MEAPKTPSHSQYRFGFLTLTLLTLVSLLSHTVPAVSSATSSSNSQSNTAYVIKACKNTTSYSTQCLNSLSPYANKIKSDPKRLCKYAISAAVADARAAKKNAKEVSKTKGLAPQERAVMRDCVDTIADSVDELRSCAAALRKVRGKMSAAKNAAAMDDLRTWASAALTDDNTCTDEMDEEKVGREKLGEFRESVVKVNGSTRILLALVTYAASS